MPKGYWIGRIDVTDPDAYRKYVAADAVAFAKYGARFLVRGGKADAVEGTGRQRNVVIEFPSYDQAVACWRSPEYVKAREFRVGAAVADIVIVEGYDGTQP
jgi:uncharacterized protein (DUF1330 family)